MIANMRPNAYILQEFDQNILREQSAEIHEGSSAFVFVAMGHGRAGGEMKLSENTFINLSKDIVDKFDRDRCPKLRGKPKIFLYQACRGTGGFQW